MGTELVPVSDSAPSERFDLRADELDGEDCTLRALEIYDLLRAFEEANREAETLRLRQAVMNWRNETARADDAYRASDRVISERASRLLHRIDIFV